MLSKKLATVVAASLITASSAAVAQTAQPLSLTNSPAVARSGADLQGQNNLDRRGYGIYVVGVIVLGLIIWGIVKLVDNNNNGPSSP
jgi:hypothetical protein